MNKTLIIGILILHNIVFGQIPGKRIEGPIVLSDNITVNQGDIMYLGKGSDPGSGDFIYLYAPKAKLVNTLYTIFSNNDDLSYKAVPRQNLVKDFAGKQLLIESFNEVSSRKKGQKIFGVVNMDDIQFVEGIYLNKIVVDLEPAIKSGEIIKISAPELAEKAPTELLFSPFVMTSTGIEPVVVAINNLNKNELYSKSVNWAISYYGIQNQATINNVPEEKINISDIAKNVKFATFIGQDIIADLPYIFTIDFTDGEITMTFKIGSENGDIIDENGEVIANISPSHMFNKNGDVHKMSQVFKDETEKVMNNLSYALVDYLMK